MSLSLADYSARIRDSLVDAKDAVLRIPPSLSETSLTTLLLLALLLPALLLTLVSVASRLNAEWKRSN